MQASFTPAKAALQTCRLVRLGRFKPRCTTAVARQQRLLRQTHGVRASSSADSSSSGSGSSNPQPRLNWFDRLPAKVQYGVMIGGLVVATIVLPFLQPTFLYSSSSSSTQTATVVSAPEAPSTLPAPVLWLQSQVMPTTLPDGRTESPGVLRIYMASMIILAAFYACSATLGAIFKVAGAALKAVGIGGTPKTA